jgi:hypothetical protein
MNQKIMEMFLKCNFTEHNIEDMQPGIGNFVELLVKECASRVTSTDLEDVEGGDSSVLYAASTQLKDYFGVK